MKCDRCKNHISKKIIRGDGLPNGMTFQRQEGKDITLCADCIMELGQLDDEGKKDFFEKLGVEV